MNPVQPSVAKAIANAPRDSAASIPGMAPNYGQFAVPPILTVQGMASNLARVYRPSDEALRASYEDARRMRIDVGIRECIDARQRSVALLDWSLIPEDHKSPLQKQLCEDLTAIINRIPRFMQYRENLLEAIWFGRAAVQSRYQWRNIGGKMRCLPTACSPIHGDKLVFSVDNPDCVGIRIGMGTHYKSGDTIPGGYELFDLSKLKGAGYPGVMTEHSLAYMLTPDRRRLVAVHKHQIKDGSFDDPLEAGQINGTGIRNTIYWEWFQKQELLAFLMEYLERSALGIEVWYYPANNPQAEAQIKEAVKARISNGHNVLFVPRPQGEEASYGVEHIEPGMQGVQQLHDLLEKYFGHRIKRYILGQTLTTESEGGGLGSDGIARVHQATFYDIVKYDAINLEETLTTDLVDVLKLFNFPSASNIHIRFSLKTQEDDVEQKLNALKNGWEMFARIPEESVFKCLGIGAPEPGDRVLPFPGQQPQQEGEESSRNGKDEFTAELTERLSDKGLLKPASTQQNNPGVVAPRSNQAAL